MKNNPKLQPRPEYPRPSFVRENWQNLNGEWEFYIDNGNSGEDRKVYEQAKFDQKIIVPFCPESNLSGIGNPDFMPSVWYAKNIIVTEEERGGRILLHIGACDHKTKVYVNGKLVGTHIGGYTSFSFDVTDFVTIGENRIVVHAEDDSRVGIQGKQAIGKQAVEYQASGCVYSRTTGIWQTVWLEFLPKTYIKSVKVNATNLNGKVILETKLNTYCKNAKVKVDISFKGETLFSEIFPVDGVVNTYTASVSPVYLWDIGQPNLYDITYTLIVNKKEVDKVESYFGIRRIDIDGYKILINGKSVFQRLVLDQGYYPDSNYTAPTDEDFKKDIEMSMRLGFNGARLHQRVFEERFLYYADKMGYLVWGEFATWGINIQNPQATNVMLPQWLETVERDYNHPAIIGWIPYNEMGAITGRRNAMDAENISLMYKATKAIDSTRPVLDTSGWNHTEQTDVYDVHDYEQDTKVFKKRYRKHEKGEYYSSYATNIPYDGTKPYMVTEFGGMRWNEKMSGNPANAWGYGTAPKSVEEFCDRYEKLSDTLLNTANVTGFCYTQLYDIEQEQNGLYYYDRHPKFTEEVYDKIRQANTKKAKIEK